jgi:hypothetical protein
MELPRLIVEVMDAADLLVAVQPGSRRQPLAGEKRFVLVSQRVAHAVHTRHVQPFTATRTGFIATRLI